MGIGYVPSWAAVDFPVYVFFCGKHTHFSLRCVLKSTCSVSLLHGTFLIFFFFYHRWILIILEIHIHEFIKYTIFVHSFFYSSEWCVKSSPSRVHPWSIHACRCGRACLCFREHTVLSPLGYREDNVPLLLTHSQLSLTNIGSIFKMISKASQDLMQIYYPSLVYLRSSLNAWLLKKHKQDTPRLHYMYFRFTQFSEKNYDSTYVVYKLISWINCILGWWNYALICHAYSVQETNLLNRIFIEHLVCAKGWEDMSLSV